MSNVFHINYFGSALPYNPDNLPERSYVVGSGTNRPIGLTLQEIVELYWTVRSFSVLVGVIDLNNDPLDQFLSQGGSTNIISANAALSSLQNSSAVPPIMGNTKILKVSQRKNRICKGGSDIGFVYDKNGNITNTNGCHKLSVSKVFTAIDNNVNEGSLGAAGPIHSISSSNGAGYVQINFTDIITYNNLYWPIIIITIGNGNVTLTSDISQLGINQNAYNIGGISFCNYGVITMSGYTSTFQNVFFLVQGSIQMGTQCCDRFYYDGVDRTIASDPCYPKCQNNQYTTIPSNLNSNYINGTMDTVNTNGVYQGKVPAFPTSDW